MKTGMNRTLGLFGIAAVATIIAISNRKKIKNKAEGAKERSALAIHHRIGMPVYAYLKKKNYIPF